MGESLGEILIASGALTEEQLREGLGRHHSQKVRIGEALIELGFIDQKTVARALARQAGLPFVDLSKGSIPASILERIPAELAVEQGIVPVAFKAGKLIVAIDDPLKRVVADQLQFSIGCEVGCALAATDALNAALAKHYGAAAEEEAVAADMGLEGGDDADAPIVRLVTRMLKDALSMRASDVHIEPGGKGVIVRYRVDGVLRPIAEHPSHLAAPLLSRLKIMGSMDIAEKRKPQDGRIGMRLDGRDIDIRASILPSSHGESIVLRLLDRSANLLSLRDLGFDGEDHAWFRRLIARPHGIVLVTGPTGSGKTTTLYAALKELNKPDVKIITAEDPVEYQIAGINQVQVNARQGLTFGRILKAMLRAAPNIILVGEIRDLETAEVAVQAALTGHLVFSTLHTNDAPSAITRLVDMGVQPFLASTAIQGILAQRLVRRLCNECAEEYKPEASEIEALGLTTEAVGDSPFRRPRGCRACEGAGYRGRVGLFEFIEMDDQLREMTFKGESLESMRAAGLASTALRPLLNDGARKVIEGKTTTTEVLRVTRVAVE